MDFLVKNKHVEQLLIMKNGFDSKNKEEKEGEKNLFHVELLFHCSTRTSFWDGAKIKLFDELGHFVSVKPIFLSHFLHQFIYLS